MDFTLDPEFESFIHRKMETGRYDSASDVVRDAFRLMDERDRLQALRKDEMRRQIADGMASLRAGKHVDGDTFLAEMEGDFDELERKDHR